MTEVYGQSDDLIEIDGDIHGEISKYITSEESPVYLIFSDNTVLNIFYSGDGVWKINVILKGSLFDRITIETDSEADRYSDTVYFKDGLKFGYSATNVEKIR